MSDEEIVPCRLIGKVRENHNTIRIKIQPDSDTKFTSARPCSFVYIYSDVGKRTRRPYTYLKTGRVPLEFLIKIYNTDGVSKYIDSLEEGDDVFITFPLQKMEYMPGMFKSVLIIAGGTGITPMLQVLNAEGENGGKTHFTLLFCNTTREDIIGMSEIDVHRDIVTVTHIISNLDAEEEDVVRGRINTSIIGKASRRQNDRKFDFVFVCGKSGMLRDVCGDKAPDKSQGKVEGMLSELGYNSTNVYKF